MNKGKSRFPRGKSFLCAETDEDSEFVRRRVSEGEGSDNQSGNANHKSE